MNRGGGGGGGGGGRGGGDAVGCCEKQKVFQYQLMSWEGGGAVFQY